MICIFTPIIVIWATDQPTFERRIKWLNRLIALNANKNGMSKILKK
jgi:hypothetical protein